MRIHELLGDRNKHTFRHACRMSKKTFITLVERLMAHGLEDSRKVTAVEKVMMFLGVVGNGDSLRTANNKWQHSTETISRHVYHVTKCILMAAILQTAVGADYFKRFVNHKNWTSQIGVVDWKCLLTFTTFPQQRKKNSSISDTPWHAAASSAPSKYRRKRCYLTVGRAKQMRKCGHWCVCTPSN